MSRVWDFRPSSMARIIGAENLMGRSVMVHRIAIVDHTIQQATGAGFADAVYDGDGE